MIEPPSNAQHLSKASSRAGAAGVWRRNPAGDISIMSDVSIMSRTPTREKEKNDITWFWSHETRFLVDLWTDKASHRGGRRILGKSRFNPKKTVQRKGSVFCYRRIYY